MVTNALLTVLEVGFVLLIVTGVALWSIAAALIVAGVAGVVAVERAAARPPVGKEPPP